MQTENAEMLIERDTNWFNTILPKSHIKFKDEKSNVPHSFTASVRWGINKAGEIYISSVVLNGWKSNENLMELDFEVSTKRSIIYEGRSKLVLTDMILQLCASKNEKRIQLTFS